LPAEAEVEAEAEGAEAEAEEEGVLEANSELALRKPSNPPAEVADEGGGEGVKKPTLPLLTAPAPLPLAPFITLVGKDAEANDDPDPAAAGGRQVGHPRVAVEHLRHTGVHVRFKEEVGQEIEQRVQAARGEHHVGVLLAATAGGVKACSHAIHRRCIILTRLRRRAHSHPVDPHAPQQLHAVPQPAELHEALLPRGLLHEVHGQVHGGGTLAPHQLQGELQAEQQRHARGRREHLLPLRRHFGCRRR